MTNERQQLIADLQDLMSDKQLSQAQVASQIGKSPSVVSQYVKGTYGGDNDAVDKLVASLLHRYREKSKQITQGYVETTHSRAINALIEVTHATSDITIVIGDAGLGKTMAVKEYVRHHDDVVFVEVDPTYNAKVLLSALCDKLSIPAARNNNDMMTSVIKRLQGSNRLIVIDEAELLPLRALEIIRRIHDRAGVGVVMAGMPRLRANLRGKRGELKQLYSRVAYCHDLGMALPDDDMASLATATMGESTYNPTLLAIADGNARRLAKLTAGVKRFAQATGEPLCDAMIKQFANQLIN